MSLYTSLYFLLIVLYLNETNAGIFITGFNINVQNYSHVLCKLFYYTSYIATKLLSTILILASIDRLLISSQNVDTRLYSSKRLAYFSLSIGIFIWITFYIHILIKVDIYEIYPTVFTCYYDLSGFYFAFITYSSLVINILSFVALIILSIMIFKNVRKIRVVSRPQRRQFRSMTKKDFQFLLCLYAYDIIYIIFAMFSTVFPVYLATRNVPPRESLQAAIETFAGQLATFSHHIPYCAGFFVFISVSRAFRQEIKRMAYKMYGKNVVVINEEENKQKKNVIENVEFNVIGAVETIELPA